MTASEAPTPLPTLPFGLTLSECELLRNALALFALRLDGTSTHSEKTNGQPAHWYAARYTHQQIVRLDARLETLAESFAQAEEK